MCSFCFSQGGGVVDVNQLDVRFREVDRKARAGAYAKKKEALALELEAFLLNVPGGGNAEISGRCKSEALPGAQGSERKNTASWGAL